VDQRVRVQPLLSKLAFCHAGIADLEKLVEPTTRGHPETCLRWTCKSVRKLAAELHELGHQVSYPVVAELLHELDYSLQANRKTKEGEAHPDRNAQFAYIDQKVQAYLGPSPAGEGARA
jgi:hypothetical protein